MPLKPLKKSKSVGGLLRSSESIDDDIIDELEELHDFNETDDKSNGKPSLVKKAHKKLVGSRRSSVHSHNKSSRFGEFALGKSRRSNSEDDLKRNALKRGKKEDVDYIDDEQVFVYLFSVL